MLSIDDYIETAKKRQSFNSNRQLSVALGLNPSMASHFITRRAWPADDTMLRLADLAGLDRQQALLDLNLWRSSDPLVREQYSEIARLVRRAGQAVPIIALLLGPIVALPDGTKAAQTTIESPTTVYYGKLS